MPKNKRQFDKQVRFAQRKRRVKASLKGRESRLRLAVYRSAKHISVQIIDDITGKTMAAASDKELSAPDQKKGKTDKAALVGTLIAEKAKQAKISSVSFDRSGYRYHGRVKALAEAAREAGLGF